jgi:7,8-dihydropterin-6-yl-methyl-4-(beta-D-ribofuranosyl)aminobenzene 5'-phosphate synthase
MVCVASFGPIDEDREFSIKEIGKYNFKKIACNHCTGLGAVQRMIELGYPAVRGTVR